MQYVSKKTQTVLAFVVTSLLVTACGGGSTDGDDGTGTGDRPEQMIAEPSSLVIGFIPDLPGSVIDQDVVVISEEGTEQRDLAQTDQYDAFIETTPDGRLLMLQQDITGQSELYTVTPDGFNQRTVYQYNQLSENLVFPTLRHTNTDIYGYLDRSQPVVFNNHVILKLIEPLNNCQQLLSLSLDGLSSVVELAPFSENHGIEAIAGENRILNTIVNTDTTCGTGLNSKQAINIDGTQPVPMGGIENNIPLVRILDDTAIFRIPNSGSQPSRIIGIPVFGGFHLTYTHFPISSVHVQFDAEAGNIDKNGKLLYTTIRDNFESVLYESNPDGTENYAMFVRTNARITPLTSTGDKLIYQLSPLLPDPLPSENIHSIHLFDYVTEANITIADEIFRYFTMTDDRHVIVSKLGDTAEVVTLLQSYALDGARYPLDENVSQVLARTADRVVYIAFASNVSTDLELRSIQTRGQKRLILSENIIYESFIGMTAQGRIIFSKRGPNGEYILMGIRADGSGEVEYLRTQADFVKVKIIN